MKRDTLVIAGLTTECCIDSTARDAFERDYHVFIAADAVAAYEPDLHEAALKALELNCAILAASADIAAAWKISSIIQWLDVRRGCRAWHFDVKC